MPTVITHKKRQNGLLILINYYYGLVTRVKIRPYGLESKSKKEKNSYHKCLQRRPFGILLLISYKHYGLATGVKWGQIALKVRPYCHLAFTSNQLILPCHFIYSNSLSNGKFSLIYFCLGSFFVLKKLRTGVLRRIN